jgi:hypothetical protein
MGAFKRAIDEAAAKVDSVPYAGLVMAGKAGNNDETSVVTPPAGSVAAVESSEGRSGAMNSP